MYLGMNTVVIYLSFISTLFALSTASNESVFHLVFSRFQQFQPHLHYLAEARYHLFKSICFPSMLGQTTQNFIWIIATDPELEQDIKLKMVSLLGTFSHYIFVPTLASIRFSEFIDGRYKDFPIWSGSIDTWTKDYSRHTVKIFTRIDADDGMNVHYFADLQSDAKKHLEASGQWAKGYCLQDKQATMHWSAENNHFGKLTRALEGDRSCITPGITFAFSGNNTYLKFMYDSHTKLFHHIRSEDQTDLCGAVRRHHCIVTGISDDVNYPYFAIRARTITSAGMKDVDAMSEDHELIHLSDAGREQKRHFEFCMSADGFNISDIKALRAAVRYIIRHQVKIANDSLNGQCTSHHSCKQSSKAKLEALLHNDRI